MDGAFFDIGSRLTTPASALLINLVVTCFLTGLIWFVQVVHYPLFDGVDPECWRDYHRRHTRRTTCVVIGPMLIELAASVWLWHVLRDRTSVLLLALTLGVWLSTFLLQVPLHDRLSGNWCMASSRRLTRTNLLRTLLWSTRALILTWLVIRGGLAGQVTPA